MAVGDLYAGIALNVGIIVSVILVVLACIAGVFFYIKKAKRYKQFKCLILERDGLGQTRILYDDAGIFVDGKTQNKRFFMKRANVGLEPDNIPYISDEKGKKTVLLVRSGLKNFRFIKPSMNAMGTLGFQVGEEDLNWAINAYEAQKKRFNNSLLMQLLPYAIFSFVAIIILILVIYVYQKFDVLVEVAQHLDSAAESVARASTGTVVIE